ncbi:MAG: hypothetical protein WAO98_00765 [Alphaproteobacteria bacterium]
MAQSFPLVIAGGNNLIAPYLMKQLHARGLTAEVLSRHHVPVPEGFKFTQLDLTKARNWIAPENALVISLLPLPVLAQFLPRFIGIKSMLAVGTASRFMKAHSRNPAEQANAVNIKIAEEMFLSWCVRSNVKFTLLRGAMIYDGVRDYNVVRMARFIQRYRFIPLAAPASGLRQPIHAEDVAKAIINSLGNEAVYGKDLNIAGGEVITYRTMAERIFEGLGMLPRLWMLETGLLKKGVELASKTGLVRESFFNTSVFQRMNEDLIFDVEEGLQLLKYEPRDFHPTIQFTN